MARWAFQQGRPKRLRDLPNQGDLLLDIMVRTCNGRLTCAEVMGHREFTLTKLHMSA